MLYSYSDHCSSQFHFFLSQSQWLQFVKNIQLLQIMGKQERYTAIKWKSNSLHVYFLPSNCFWYWQGRERFNSGVRYLQASMLYSNITKIAEFYLRETAGYTKRIFKCVIKITHYVPCMVVNHVTKYVCSSNSELYLSKQDTSPCCFIHFWLSFKAVLICNVQLKNSKYK